MLPTSLSKLSGHVGLAVDTRPVFSYFTLGVESLAMAARQALLFRVGVYANLSSLVAGQRRSQQAVFGFRAVCFAGLTGPTTPRLSFCSSGGLLRVATRWIRQMRAGVQDRGNASKGPDMRHDGNGMGFPLGAAKREWG